MRAARTAAYRHTSLCLIRFVHLRTERNSEADAAAKQMAPRERFLTQLSMFEADFNFTYSHTTPTTITQTDPGGLWF